MHKRILIFESSKSNVEEIENSLNRELKDISQKYDITKIDTKIIFKFLWYTILQYEITYTERTTTTEQILITSAFNTNSIVKIVNGKNMSRRRFSHEVDRIKAAIERAEITVASSSSITNINENFFHVMFSNEYAEKFDKEYNLMIAPAEE